MRSRVLPGLILFALVVAACQPAPPTPTPAPPTPVPPTTIRGVLRAPVDGAPLAGQPVALCQLTEASPAPPAVECVLHAPAAVTDERGEFAFVGVEPGRYLLVYASGRGDFDAALARHAGQVLRPGDWPWLRDEFLALAPDAFPALHLPAALTSEHRFDRAGYAVQTLMLGESPLLVAHVIELEGRVAATGLLVVTAHAGRTTSVEVAAHTPQPPDLAAERARIGPLGREELALVDRDVSARWARFLSGDDAAYDPLDAHLIEALRASDLHEIGEAYFAPVRQQGEALVAAPGYVVIDLLTGERQTLGWLDESTGDVVEAATGYRLNIRDEPGVWLEEGPGGEQFYRYGFSYYRRWGQTLPDPVIALVDGFYTDGARHVDRHINDYRAVGATFSGDLVRVPWYPGIFEMIDAWQPAAAPAVLLPDSGTVDIRRERFAQAVDEGYVVVDAESVDAFLRSEVAREGRFSRRLDRDAVVDALLTPYRSGRLFSDLEAAIILAATYGGDEHKPLTIRISSGLEQGFLVPRYREKEIFVSPDEVANVLLGYPGALNSRWAHEMGHVVDFRAPQYTFEGKPERGSRCEPVKYLMEFMWWVESYPGDAPDWDWMPINSGLTLARLLTEKYHNSRC